MKPTETIPGFYDSMSMSVAIVAFKCCSSGTDTPAEAHKGSNGLEEGSR